MEDEFTHIYERNFWGGEHSRSGVGSGLDQTATLVEELPGLFRSFGVASILDAPCGDFAWMNKVDLAGIRYIGGDIVAALIAENNAAYRSETVEFRQLDLTSDPLPRVDLILCRDGLVHLPFADIRRALRNMTASGSTYLLTTTFTERPANADCRIGNWRTLNLARPPFSFPAPLAILNENCTQLDGQFADKSLGLWKLSSIMAALQESPAVPTHATAQ